MFPKSKKRKSQKEEPIIIESKSINKNYKYSLEVTDTKAQLEVEKLKKEIENLDKPETQTTLTSELIETIGKLQEITPIIQTTFLLTCI